ncbi:TPA: restriction endonuclease subunit S [Legionella pneumophila]
MVNYPAYKNSGVSWLGEIPKHWELKPLRAIFHIRNEKNSPVKTVQILSLSIAKGVTLYSDKGRGGNKAKDDLTAYKIAHPNDIVLNSMNVIVGAVGLSKYFGAISPVYYAIYVRQYNHNDINYYAKIFSNHNFQRYLSIYGKGILIKKTDTGKLNTIRMKISLEDLKKIVLPIPPTDEQIKISRYLDWKTSKINKFIKAKIELIALLKEQKKNIINEAITKGINPNQKMKDSGIGWLGETPEHWDLKKLKFCSTMKSGENLTSQDINESGLFPVYGGNGIRGYYDKFNKKGTYLLIGRQGALCGNVHKIDGEFWATEHAVVTTVKEDINIDWYFFMLSFMNLNQYSESAAQPGISVEKILKLKTAVPPLIEQQEIANHIYKETHLINKTIARTLKEIELIQEYQTRLISDLVTGKIDVRSINIPDVEPIDKEADISEDNIDELVQEDMDQ